MAQTERLVSRLQRRLVEVAEMLGAEPGEVRVSGRREREPLTLPVLFREGNWEEHFDLDARPIPLTLEVSLREEGFREPDAGGEEGTILDTLEVDLAAWDFGRWLDRRKSGRHETQEEVRGWLAGFLRDELERRLADRLPGISGIPIPEQARLAELDSCLSPLEALRRHRDLWYGSWLEDYNRAVARSQEIMRRLVENLDWGNPVLDNRQGIFVELPGAIEDGGLEELLAWEDGQVTLRIGRELGELPGSPGNQGWVDLELLDFGRAARVPGGQEYLLTTRGHLSRLRAGRLDSEPHLGIEDTCIPLAREVDQALREDLVQKFSRGARDRCPAG